MCLPNSMSPTISKNIWEAFQCSTQQTGINFKVWTFGKPVIAKGGTYSITCNHIFACLWVLIICYLSLIADVSNNIICCQCISLGCGSELHAKHIAGFIENAATWTSNSFFAKTKCSCLETGKTVGDQYARERLRIFCAGCAPFTQSTVTESNIS